MQIVSAIMLVGFLIFMFPRAKYMLANSPKGSSSQWLNVVVIFGVIFLFILLLVQLV